jgi:hypothetical protein
MSNMQFLPREYHTPEPFTRPISSIVLAPTLEPIPGSAVVTPAARPSPTHTPPTKHRQAAQSAELSEALGIVKLEEVRHAGEQESDSYFTPPTNPPDSEPTTPGRRRPAIEIPASTPDQPRFQSYPHLASSSSSSEPIVTDKQFARFSLRHPSIRKKPSLRRDLSSKVETDEEGGVTSDDADEGASTRRRSSSLSLARTTPPRQAFSKRPPTVVSGRRRAGSVGARIAAEYHEGDDDAWKHMAKAEAARLHIKPAEPFTYQQPANPPCILQTPMSTMKPDQSPKIGARRSSLLPAENPVDGMGSSETLESPEQHAMPHEPPPRRSSLEITPITTMTHLNDLEEQGHLETRSNISSSLLSSITCSDPSLFSPTTSSQEHPLSSATTSLSRSAKSAKEGTDEHDAALTAVKLQRSLEWEAKQNKRRGRLDKRKMVLLELVETEVAYAEGLRALVQVYLPQLAALPSVSERTAAMIARNAPELLDFHSNLATRMVQVLKVEGIAYDIIHDPDVPVERAARKISSLFIEHVSILPLVLTIRLTLDSLPCLGDIINSARDRSQLRLWSAISACVQTTTRTSAAVKAYGALTRQSLFKTFSRTGFHPANYRTDPVFTLEITS